VPVRVEECPHALGELRFGLLDVLPRGHADMIALSVVTGAVRLIHQPAASVSPVHLVDRSG
jgi:hypothetical protein